MSIDISVLRRIISDEKRLLTGGDIPREYLSEEVVANAGLHPLHQQAGGAERDADGQLRPRR